MWIGTILCPQHAVQCAQLEKDSSQEGLAGWFDITAAGLVFFVFFFKRTPGTAIELSDNFRWTSGEERGEENASEGNTPQK